MEGDKKNSLVLVLSSISFLQDSFLSHPSPPADLFSLLISFPLQLLSGHSSHPPTAARSYSSFTFHCNYTSTRNFHNVFLHFSLIVCILISPFPFNPSVFAVELLSFSAAVVGPSL